MPTYNPNDFSPMSGKEINSLGNVVTPADGINTDGSQNVQITKHKQTTLQTHTNQSIPASGEYQYAGWLDTDGYDKVATTLLNDASTSNYAYVYWSNDGATVQGYETIISSAATKQRAGIIDTKARYVKLVVGNGDTAAHVMNAWLYLKS